MNIHWYRSTEDPRDDDNVPCVLLTGLSSSVVRKLKQVRNKKVATKISVPILF